MNASTSSRQMVPGDLYSQASKDVRTALALSEQRRRNRRANAEQDHFERTRHSMVMETFNPATGRREFVEIGHVKPTGATQAKLRQNPVARMLDKGSLSREQATAAFEIAEVYTSVTAKLMARAATGERVGGAAPLHDTRIDKLHAANYLPWARYLGGHPATDKLEPIPARCPTALELSIDVVVDGVTLAECEKNRKWRHGTAALFLRYALAVYADLAGWERNRDLMAEFERQFTRGRVAA